MAAVDLDVLLTQLTLVGPVNRADLLQAITEPPVVTRELAGASTLDVTVTDRSRTLLRSGMFSHRSWALVDGLTYELVQARKTGDRIALQFEDALVAALRRQTKALSVPAGRLTREQFLRQLAAEAKVPLLVEPGRKAKVAAVLERSTGGQTSNSWEVGQQVADGAGWRCLSDGRRWIVGSDAWLARVFAPVTLREHTGPVYNIDLDLDVGRPASSATVELDGTRAGVPCGTPATLAGMGPGDRRWVVERYSRPLTRKRATLQLTAPRPVLTEPPPESARSVSDAGERDALPDSFAEPAASAPGRAASPAAERMVRWALGKQGLPYVWGGKGPRGFDCSGFVAAASAAAGKPLSGSSKTQWSTVRQAGKTLTVADALRTRGALLFRMNTEPSHVAISLGDGRTVEARGRAQGCGVFGGAGGRGWTGGALWV